jgi:FtsP/CotA-like multicopper oxidase with cupredoxin domain
MGTVPGPVIECEVGESMTVHFRNKDSRSGKPIEARTHSLHPHGFVFDPRYDGAYPLSPPDPTQPVGAEAALWEAVGVTGFKRGDRVPPGGSFNYTWQTIGWPTTAGVWLYHDHSICDMDNVALGAIGIIVIHNPADPEDIIIEKGDLPGESFVGNVWVRKCTPFPFDVAIQPHDLIALGRISPLDQPPGLAGAEGGVMAPGGAHGGMAMDMLAAVGGLEGMHAAGKPAVMAMPAAAVRPALAVARHGPRSKAEGLEGREFHALDSDSLAAAGRAHQPTSNAKAKGSEGGAHADRRQPTKRGAAAPVGDMRAMHAGEDHPVLARSIQLGDVVLELNRELTKVALFCPRFYRTPPARAQYLMLFHSMPGVSMCINGRKYLGNTPTMVAGPQTDMRFGVVGMGNVDGFHTFHLHGHRWTLNGPHGNNRAAIQGSIQDTPVSQFEDTRTFGPANSFAFTIKEGSLNGVPSFMGAAPGKAVGEWHMHCHVLNHMMDGMMGSLLVVNGGALAGALPKGVECPPPTGEGPPTGVVHTVLLHPLTPGGVPEFDPKDITIAVGDSIHWDWGDGAPHSTTSDSGLWDSGVKTGLAESFDRAFASSGVFPYHCSIHGATGGIGMSGTVTVI